MHLQWHSVGRWGGQLTTCSFWMWLEVQPLCHKLPYCSRKPCPVNA